MESLGAAAARSPTNSGWASSPPASGAQRRVRMESACSWGSWQQLAAECPLRPGPGRVGPEALGVCGLEAGPAASGLEREGRGAGKAGVAARPLRELG